MTKTQIDLVKININILTAWIETLEMRLKRAVADDEPPLINEIENYRALVRNLEGVLQIERENS